MHNKYKSRYQVCIAYKRYDVLDSKMLAED